MMRYRPIFYIQLSVFILYFFYYPSLAGAFENGESIAVWGEAVIYEGNIPQAKKRALQEAFSAAITQVMGSYITAESFTQNYVSIDRSVLSRTKGYVKNYEILEIKEEPEILNIHVMVVVSAESVKDDLTALGILLDAKGNPVVEISGKDQGLDVSQSIPVFKRILSAKGFYLVESANAGQADMTVFLNGAITSQNVLGTSEMHGVVVELNARAVRKSSQKVVASESAVSNGAGLSKSAALKQAYRQAAETLSSKLIASISEKWSRELAEGQTFSLAAKTNDFTKVQRFSKHLSRTFGVKKADMKSFKNGEARYLVRFAGVSKTLADILLRTHHSGFQIRVTGLDSDTLDVVLD